MLLPAYHTGFGSSNVALAKYFDHTLTRNVKSYFCSSDLVVLLYITIYTVFFPMGPVAFRRLMLAITIIFLIAILLMIVR
jgi:hypothetical protein